LNTHFPVFDILVLFSRYPIAIYQYSVTLKSDNMASVQRSGYACSAYYVKSKTARSPILSYTDPGFCTQAALRWHNKKSGDRLPLLFARPDVTFPVAEHRRSLAGTNLYCSVTETQCKQLAHRRYLAVNRPRVEPATCWSRVRCPHLTPPSLIHIK